MIKTAFIYLVSWCLVKRAECPDYKPDAFGRMPMVHCDVYHTETDCNNVKRFVSRDSAIAFYQLGIKERLQIKIDSTQIK